MQLKMDVYTDCGKKEKKQTTLPELSAWTLVPDTCHDKAAPG